MTKAVTPTDDVFDEYDEYDCWNCGGEGFVYGCSWDWQCDTWDGDSCLCTRPCHICYPPNGAKNAEGPRRVATGPFAQDRSQAAALD